MKDNIIISLFVSILCVGCSNKAGQPETLSYDIVEKVVLEEEKITSPKLDSFDYEILGTDHTNHIDNFYVFLKNVAINEDSLRLFVNAFKNTKCNKSYCNISILDDKKAYPTIKKYPLSKSEYLMIADRFVAMYNTDMGISLYPYQDFQYRDYGGKNWKVKPIE